MKTNYLFPYKLKKIALFILLFSFLGATYITVFEYNPDITNIKTGEYITNKGEVKPHYENIANEIVGMSLIVSLLLLAFSKEKEEDEYISKIRLESLVWAVYINYGLLLIAFVLFYDEDFLSVMIYNMFTLLLFFNIRFQYYKFKMRKELSYEK